MLRRSTASNTAASSPPSSLNYTNMPTLTSGRTINQSQTGMCSVCRRTGRPIHIVNTTGLLRQHGPRNNVCRGSRKHPFPGSQQLILSQSHPSQSLQAAAQTLRSDASVEVEVNITTASTPSSTDVLEHHPRRQILKRIPKEARPAAANLLQKLISDVLLHPSSLSSWSRLLGFSIRRAS